MVDGEWIGKSGLPDKSYGLRESAQLTPLKHPMVCNKLRKEAVV